MSSQKKQPSARRKTTHRRQRRYLLLIAALIAAAVVIYLCVQLFGDVKVSSPGDNASLGDVSSSATVSVSETAPGTTQAGQTTTQAAATTTVSVSETVPGTTTQVAATTTTSTNKVSGHYVQPAGAEWYLKLVNPWNAISADYSLQLVTYSGSNRYDSRAVDSLRQMLRDGGAYNLYAASLYRDPTLQTSLFERETAKWTAKGYSQADAEEKASQTVARPYTSEHNLGLAADILGSGYSSLEQSFEKTDAFRWLKEHCAEYGFILRYPKEKIDITGVVYEPWHYRYVGKEAAKEIMSRSITLEEYLEEKGK